MSDIATLAFKLDHLIAQQQDTQKNITELTRTVSQLALIEERQTADRKAVERLTEDNTDLEKRVRHLEQQLPNALDLRLCELEKKMPMHALGTSWVFKAVWLVVAAVMGGLINALMGKS